MTRSSPNRAFSHKPIVFLVCLALATVTYLNYRASLITSVNYVIPIELNTPSDLIVTYQETKEVHLTISGRQSSLEDVSAADLEASVDLSTFEPGNWSATIHVNQGLLREKQLRLDLQPTTIGIKLEKLASKQVPILANLVGNPPTGYLRESYQIIPEKVLISGPASVVETITQLTTEQVDVSGRNKSFQTEAELQVPHPLLTISPRGSVTYRVTMKEETGVLTLSVPVTLENLAGRLQAGELRPSVVGVTLSGGQLSLARLGAGEQNALTARVDASNITEPGRYILPISVSGPPELVVVKVEPERLALIVRQKDQGPVILGDRSSPTAPILPGPLSSTQ